MLQIHGLITLSWATSGPLEQTSLTHLCARTDILLLAGKNLLEFITFSEL